MGLNDTPSANRIHIGFFGRRNAGKSSVVNAVTDQDLAVVSDRQGTTTDPVTKAMELLPLGPVVIIDTPGYDDDEQVLGELRIKKTRKILNKSDIAVLVVDSTEGLNAYDNELIELFKSKKIPFIIAYNKADLLSSVPHNVSDALWISAKTRRGIHELKERLGRLAPKDNNRRLVGDLLQKDDIVVLVTPIDQSAPKGRLILPQQQTIRDILDADAASVVVKDTQLAHVLDRMGDQVAMVITDSQVFKPVDELVPQNIPLTSFSILLARYKGFLEAAVAGVVALKNIEEDDLILIAEGCSHHRQCNDIGTVKIPRWLEQFSGHEVNFETCSGTEFPDDVTKYKVIVHCGGCMLSDKEMSCRMKCALDQGIPFTNYGVTIAYMQGILQRGLEVFPDLQKLLEN